jgi:hypothetical protein
MNILVVGNGFDLAHGLPTRYIDFLNFAALVSYMKVCSESGGTFNKDDKQIGKTLPGEISEYITWVNQKIKNGNLNCETHQVIDTVRELHEINPWFKHFEDFAEANDGNWIDFEQEISAVIQELEEDAPGKLYTEGMESLKKACIRKAKQLSSSSAKLSDELCGEILLEELNKLINCLELFLEDCVGKIDSQLISPDIHGLSIDKVLSFNYTNTYKRVYEYENKRVECHYIHGQARMDKNLSNNMVLGIDESLPLNERSSDVRFIGFKKYYQRIHKATGNLYKNWLENIEQNQNQKHNIYVFGHSLDITDKDVLSELLLCENAKITIYYLDKVAHGQQIANLVKVLGQEKLIELTYGKNARIEFKRQKDMEKKTEPKWQSASDIRNIWNMHSLTTQEAEAVIAQVRKSILEFDISYCVDQRNTISLYNAMVENIGISAEEEEALFQIVQNLCDDEQYERFNGRDWFGDPPLNDPDRYINEKTRNFIDRVNKYNQKVFTQKLPQELISKLRNVLPLNNDIIDNVKRELLDGKLSLKLFKWLLRKLFLMCDKRSVDIFQYWKYIFLLLGKVNLEENRDEIEHFIEQEYGARINGGRNKRMKEMIVAIEHGLSFHEVYDY